jgi:hypothetical protein
MHKRLLGTLASQRVSIFGVVEHTVQSKSNRLNSCLLPLTKVLIGRHPVVQLGGGFKEPPVSEDPLFRLHARSRMNIYLDTDEEASILIDANIVHQGGESLPSCFWPKEGKKSAPVGLEISYDGKVLKSTEVDLDTVDNEVTISLDGFKTSFDAHHLTVKATFGKKTTFTDTAELLYLSYPEDYGSVSRLDDLYGGLHVQRGKENPWEVIFPYTYYCTFISIIESALAPMACRIDSISSMDSVLERGRGRSGGTPQHQYPRRLHCEGVQCHPPRAYGIFGTRPDPMG